jgi:hypothetical protein
MAILNNGRIGLGTGSVGGAKALLHLSLAHVADRHQFGAPLADLELVQEKLGWMVSYLFGLESMCYLTTGLIDSGVSDYSLESAVCKVAGTEFLWYQVNRALQLAGGEGYLRTHRYEKVLRDVRIFPIFEGANDVLRSYVALTGMKPLGEQLSDLGNIGLSDPIGSLGVLVDYVGARVRSGLGQERLRGNHEELERHAKAVGDQVAELHEGCAKLLRRHRREIVQRGLHHRRVSDAVADILAQIAVISRVSGLLDDQGLDLSGQERHIADVFCDRAARRGAPEPAPARAQRRRAGDRDRAARLAPGPVQLRLGGRGLEPVLRPAGAQAARVPRASGRRPAYGAAARPQQGAALAGARRASPAPRTARRCRRARRGGRPGSTRGPWLKWLNDQSPPAAPSVQASGAKRSANSRRSRSRWWKRLTQSTWVPAGTAVPPSSGLGHRLARQQRCRRVQAHRVLQAGAQVPALDEPGLAGDLRPDRAAPVGVRGDQSERSQRVGGQRVRHCEEPVRDLPGRLGRPRRRRLAEQRHEAPGLSRLDVAAQAP